MKKKLRQQLNSIMIFNDQEQLSNIYAGMLTEAKEPPCPCTMGKKCIKKDCQCSKCKDSLKESRIQEAKKKPKPDYLDVDGDGDTKEPMKKALKDKQKKGMKESSNFKDLFNRVISEAKVCGCSITKGAQYICNFNGKPGKYLSGDSVLKNKDKITSVKPVPREEK